MKGVTLSKSALVIGINGQDGSYLSELLLSKGYTVHGIVRRSSSFNTARINHIYEDPHQAGRRLLLHYGDLTDSTGLRRVIETALPDEIYNLGAQSHVKVSFENPEHTADSVGVLRLLDCMRDHLEHTGRQVRFYQAGSSEMFGAASPPQNELTPFYPRSPYAVSKVAAHWYAINYREAYNLFISNGILFNHESPRRGETFVTRKITRAVGRIKAGLRRNSTSGTWRLVATGGLPATMSSRCGRCYSTPNRATLWWRPANLTPFVSSWKKHSPMPGWIGRNMWKLIPNISAQLKWTICWVILRKLVLYSVGALGPVSSAWYA